MLIYYYKAKNNEHYSVLLKSNLGRININKYDSVLLIHL